MRKALLFQAAMAIALTVCSTLATPATAQIRLLAVGELTSSRAGNYTDLSGLNYTLENGVRATELGGFGSAIAYAGRNTFLALPDRGPNAVEFDDAIDNTVSYVNRFHTVSMDLEPNYGGGLPFHIDPHAAGDQPALESVAAGLRQRSRFGRRLGQAADQ